jgi:hypothetical protein
LRQRALDTAIAEINKKTDLNIGHWFAWVEIGLWLDRWQNHRLCF